MNPPPQESLAPDGSKGWVTRVTSRLRQEIGLDAASVGSSLIERTLRLRMKNLGLKNLEAYARHLAASSREWEALVESVVVTETWFFRDRESFNALVQLALLDWLPRHAVGQMRLLSLPCSSGEEPYSLAMALLDAFVPPGRFSVEATDISSRALAHAHRSVYGKNSFRGKDLAYRDRHFQPSKEGYVLRPKVRNCVRFTQGNVLDGGFSSGREPYDFLFCRNLLIYFDRATQARAVKTIRDLLAPDGVLFVGAAELPVVLENGFVSANLPMAFACRKAGASATFAATRRARVTRTHAAATRFSIEAAPATPPSLAEQTSSRPLDPHEPRERSELERARTLADAGKLEEAAEMCETHLRDCGPSAQVYYLLGLVRDAGGDPEAADCYRRALYLDPNHYESLWQMALLLEKNGDTAGARTFKRRAGRVKTT